MTYINVEKRYLDMKILLLDKCLKIILIFFLSPIISVVQKIMDISLIFPIFFPIFIFFVILSLILGYEWRREINIIKKRQRGRRYESGS